MTFSRLLLVASLVTLPFMGHIILPESAIAYPAETMLTPAYPRDFAQRPARGRRGDMMEQLNLTDQQKRQLSDIRQKYQQQIDPKRQQMRVSRQEMNQMLANNDAASSIRTKHQEIMRLHEEIGNLRLNSMLEIREILTPEQRREFAQLMEQRRGAYRQRPMDDTEDLIP